MTKSNELEPDNYPWDLRVIAGYKCPVCSRTYISPGWCPNKLIGAENSLQGHPQVQLIPDAPQVVEK